MIGLNNSWKLGGMSMSKINLLPCPFCGGEARIIGAVGTVFWVKCTECGAETQSEITKQRAAERWNRRAGEQNE